MKQVLAALIGLALALSLSACNTMQGFGKDVSNAGQAIESAAHK